MLKIIWFILLPPGQRWSMMSSERNEIVKAETDLEKTDNILHQGFLNISDVFFHNTHPKKCGVKSRKRG